METQFNQLYGKDAYKLYKKFCNIHRIQFDLLEIAMIYPRKNGYEHIHDFFESLQKIKKRELIRNFIYENIEINKNGRVKQFLTLYDKIETSYRIYNKMHIDMQQHYDKRDICFLYQHHTPSILEIEQCKYAIKKYGSKCYIPFNRIGNRNAFKLFTLQTQICIDECVYSIFSKILMEKNFKTIILHKQVTTQIPIYVERRQTCNSLLKIHDELQKYYATHAIEFILANCYVLNEIARFL